MGLSASQRDRLRVLAREISEIVGGCLHPDGRPPNVGGIGTGPRACRASASAGPDGLLGSFGIQFRLGQQQSSRGSLADVEAPTIASVMADGGRDQHLDRRADKPRPRLGMQRGALEGKPDRAFSRLEWRIV